MADRIAKSGASRSSGRPQGETKNGMKVMKEWNVRLSHEQRAHRISARNALNQPTTEQCLRVRRGEGSAAGRNVGPAAAPVIVNQDRDGDGVQREPSEAPLVRISRIRRWCGLLSLRRTVADSRQDRLRAATAVRAGPCRTTALGSAAFSRADPSRRPRAVRGDRYRSRTGHRQSELKADDFSYNSRASHRHSGLKNVLFNRLVQKPRSQVFPTAPTPSFPREGRAVEKCWFRRRF